MTRPPFRARPIIANKIITAQYAALYLSDPDIYVYQGLAAIASYNVGEALILTKAFEKQFPDAKTVYEALAAGNLAIYRDIQWTGLAFKDGGNTTKILSTLNPPGLVEAGWKYIEDKKIPEGTQAMVREEQEFVLQPIFGANENAPIRKALQNGTWDISIKKPFFPGMPAFPLGDYGEVKQRGEWTRQVAVAGIDYQKNNRMEVARAMNAYIAAGKKVQ